MKAIRITWTEFERGWGQRPDGATLHESRQHSDEYVERVWRSKVRKDAENNHVPDEYSRPDTEPFDLVNTREVEVSDTVWEQIVKNGGTIWE
jgi:hypothetical protein